MIRSAGVPALILSVSMCLLSSCSPKRSGIELDTSTIDALTLVQMVHARSDLVQSLEGRGTVSFESREFGGTAAFNLTLRKPDSLLVLLEGPFGIDLGSLFLSREKYLAYNSRENVVITGVPHGSTIRSVIPFDLAFDEILNAFSGSFRIPLNSKDIRRYSIDDGSFLLVIPCGVRVCSYWIDNTVLQVSRYEVHDEKGTLLLQATASSFSGDGDTSVPKRITIWFPEDDKQIAVLYSEVNINPATVSFAFDVPSDARTLRR